MLRLIPIALFAFSISALAQDWPQWSGNPQHTQRMGAIGQSLDRNLADILYDQVVDQEIAAAGGELLVHYQAPLVDGPDVFMMAKTGRFDFNTFATQTWAESKYTWQNGTLTRLWGFTTDWKPVGTFYDFFEPVFHPALANDSLYVPGAGGSIHRVDKQSGVGRRISPFPTLDANTYVVSPLTADSAGNILYNVVRVAPNANFYGTDVVDSWLVRVSPNDTTSRVSYSVLAAGAPAGTDQCANQFVSEELPWPPSSTAAPGTVVCGTQRPGINISPAIAPDGTIYTVSRAHLNSREAFLIAVTPDLHQKWMATLRNRFNDGCGVLIAQGGVLPPNGTSGGCRTGSRLGVDPMTNAPGGGRVNDSSSATPVVAPDGSVIYGAYTRYNYVQGHLVHFAADGTYLGAYRFGWDVTPAVYAHDGTYSIITKDNRYRAGSYCDSNPSLCGTDRTATNPEYPEAYFVTQLDKDMRVEWSFRNTQNEFCGRRTDGTVACTPGPSEGFEWCVNAFVVDAHGVVYANSEDGFLYAISQGGRLKNRIFQQLALGAAYTPASMDALGRVYSQNAGHLFVAGGERRRAVRSR